VVPELASHGYPRSEAGVRRLEALTKLSRYAYHRNISTVVFENPLTIKKRRYAKSEPLTVR